MAVARRMHLLLQLLLSVLNLTHFSSLSFIFKKMLKLGRGRQVFPWPTDNLTGAGFDFSYESPGGATMLATYAATHARNRLLAELESNGGLL